MWHLHCLSASLLAWSLRGQSPPLSSLPGPSTQQEPNEEPGREPSLDWCSPGALDGRRPASLFAALLKRGGAGGGGLSSDRAAGKLWVEGGQIRRARHPRSLSGRGSGSVAACGEGRRGSGRGRAGKGAGKPRVVALRPAWHPPGRKQIREPPDAGVGALGVCQGGRVTSMMLSPEEAPSCTISSSVPELQTRLPERRPGAPWMPRGRTQPQACTSPHVPSRTLQQPSAPPAASA